jgi:hypothetical protein
MQHNSIFKYGKMLPDIRFVHKNLNLKLIEFAPKSAIKK